MFRLGAGRKSGGCHRRRKRQCTVRISHRVFGCRHDMRAASRYIEFTMGRLSSTPCAQGLRLLELTTRFVCGSFNAFGRSRLNRTSYVTGVTTGAALILLHVSAVAYLSVCSMKMRVGTLRYKTNFFGTTRVTEGSLMSDLPSLKRRKRNIGRPPMPRAGRIQRAVKYMRQNATRRISTRELCVVTGFNERTLRYMFELEFGVSPVRMARRLRLELTRKQLLSADPRTRTVTEIARRFGFEDLPLFSLTYSRTFNEPPSSTLRAKALPRATRTTMRPIRPRA
jgi:AraC-like DNA-binding protein